ncbi:uncharacterized protein A4U43_C07F22900 [Asparagus officinalis]|uniref:Neprosin PEP catalytic domain-containing protein n=1 Tax=Asparagus officinalis TaxID=4686 RepID=A0A5P1EE60_ASPOF|nr:uncharacterized protein A4U43_C07F22900 [Asparagus officinalis]
MNKTNSSLNIFSIFVYPINHLCSLLDKDLGISKISKGLLEVAQIEHKLQKSYSSPKPKKKFEISELRRSSRERKPGISYSEEAYNEELVSHRRSYKRSMNKNADRAYTGRIASYQQIAAAVKRAEKLEMDLKSPHPSFVKTMVRSHVSSCFWLGLPTKFCKDNLPLSELRMVLEDEEGKEYDAVSLEVEEASDVNRGELRGQGDNRRQGSSAVRSGRRATSAKIYIIKAIPEESSYSNKKESTESTAALESITEEDLPSSQEQTLKTRSKKQAQRAGSKKQAQQPKKRFVQVNPRIHLGATLGPLSVYDGIQYAIRLLVFKDPTTGDWWLAFGKNKEAVGYWPKSLFNTLNDHATKVYRGGLVKSPINEPSAPMGSGHFAAEGLRRACYSADLYLVDGSNGYMHIPEDEVEFRHSDPGCYRTTRVMKTCCITFGEVIKIHGVPNVDKIPKYQIVDSVEKCNYKENQVIDGLMRKVHVLMYNKDNVNNDRIIRSITCARNIHNIYLSMED